MTKTRERTGSVAVKEKPSGLDTSAVETDPDQETAQDQRDGEAEANTKVTDDKTKAKQEWREYNEENGEDELTRLVRENADEIVVCSWMDGEVTLTVAMNNYKWPPYTTVADEPLLIAVVSGLLASRPIKPEEPKQQEAEAEKELTKPEDKKRPQEEEQAREKESHQKTKSDIHKPSRKPNTANASQPSKRVIETPQDLKMPVAVEGKPHTHANETVAIVIETVVNSTRDESVQPTQNSVTSEVITTKTNIPAATEVLPVTDSTPETLVQRPVVDGTEVGTKQQPEALKTTSTEAIDQKPEAPVRLALAKAPEPAELSALTTPDYSIDTSDPIDFSEQEVLISHVKEADKPIPETTKDNADREETIIPQTNGELHFTEQEAVDPEQPVQATMLELDLTETLRLSESARGDEQVILSEGEIVLSTVKSEKLVDRSSGESEDSEILAESSFMAEEIESSLTQLVERIQASEPAVAEMANEHLGKIIETVAKLEAPEKDTIITEAEAQEELEELFIELFNMMNIAYTPKFITYLAHQTLTWHLVDEIEKLKDEELEEEVQASATHPIIKKLIAALKTIKRAVAHAGAIGKAALALCSFNFQLTTPNHF